ncbi:MAG: diguanylate cyclase [Candidatus Aminicenantes bacterium]|nr:diguanylate cyclase [Candidatus Aminicenantes bacterium]
MDKKEDKNKTKLIQENKKLKSKVSQLESGFVEIKLELDALQKKQRNLISVIETTEDLFFVLGLDGTFIRFYQSSKEKDFFLDPNKTMGKHFSEVFPKNVSEQLQNAINQVEDHGNDSLFEYQMEEKGTENIFQAKVSKLDETGQKFFGFVLSIKNITESKKREDLLVENEQKYRAVFTQSTEYVFLADIDSRMIVEANRAVQNLLGYSEDEIKDLTLYDFLAVEKEDIYLKILDVLKKHSYFIGERKFRRKDGSLVDAEISVSIVTFSKKRVLCFVARDITPRKLAQEQLYQAATHDRLTGLMNRLLFYDMLSKELARARRNKYMTALVYIDLDQFKLINDTKGHSTGDKLLAAVGDRLKKIKRDGDHLARMGGDEFVVTLPEIKKEEHAIEKAENILSELQNPFDIDGMNIQITASVGCSIFPKDGTSNESLIKAADMAMYFSKTHGRNQCKRYSPEIKGEIGRH